MTAMSLFLADLSADKKAIFALCKFKNRIMKRRKSSFRGNFCLFLIFLGVEKKCFVLCILYNMLKKLLFGEI